MCNMLWTYTSRMHLYTPSHSIPSGRGLFYTRSVRCTHNDDPTGHTLLVELLGLNMTDIPGVMCMLRTFINYTLELHFCLKRESTSPGSLYGGGSGWFLFL